MQVSVPQITSFSQLANLETPPETRHPRDSDTRSHATTALRSKTRKAPKLRAHVPSAVPREPSIPRTHRGIEDSPDRLLCRPRRCRVCRRASLSPIVDAQASTAAVDHARHPTARFAGVVLLVSTAGRRDERGNLRGRDPSPEPPETHLATT